jgi:hypothetical protein
MYCPTVLWAPSISIPDEHGKPPPPHASGHRQCCGHRHLSYMVNTIKPPTCIWHKTVLWAFTIILYPTIWATRLSSIRTLPLSLVRSSPSSIKGDARPPNKEDQSHKHRAHARILSARRSSHYSRPFNSESDRTSCTPHLTPFRL